MNSLRKIITVLALIVVSSVTLQAQVSGIVFQDINGNGVKDNTTFFNEGVVQGVTVKAFDNTGAQVGGTQVTNATGNYAFTGITLPVRLEFSGFPTNNFSAPNGTSSRTSVQFVTAASTSVNFGVYTPADYCQSNPDLYVTCFINGDPLPSGSAAGQEVAIVKIPYNIGNQSSTAPVKMVDGDKVGSVWGAAYQQRTKTLLTAALLKRHVGLGSGGLGGIYKTDVTNNATSLLIDLEAAPFNINLGQSVLGSRSLPTSPTTSSEDATAFDGIGKLGLGAITLSEDQNELYVVDLFNRQVIKIAIGTPLKTTFTAADVTVLPNIPSAGCTNGVARPFGIEYYKDKVYVGVTCTGENNGTQNDLKANVFEYDPTTNAFAVSPVATFSLNYNKGKVHTSETPAKWEPWISDFSDMYFGNANNPPLPRTMLPQPMLSDIDFLDNGDMVLGFMDRAGHQLGYRNRGVGTGSNLYNGYIGGDILRLTKSGSSYVLESNGSVGSVTSTGGANNGQGPGTPGGEFYNNEQFSGVLSFGQPPVEIHQETYMGSTIFVPGNNQVVVTVMDPISVFSGGFSWFSNTNGTNDKRYQIYATLGDGGQTFGKANGLGAIEVGCNVAPIEIGNRLWDDANKNGVQDPDEPGINGVSIQLFEGLTAAGTPKATTSTTSGGQWYFNDTNVTGGLKENTDYTIKVNTPLNSGSLTGFVSFADKNAALGGILADSDVNPDGIFTIKTGVFGENNHTFDIGVINCPAIAAPAVADAERCGPGTLTATLTTSCASGTTFKIFSNVALTTDVTAQFTVNGSSIVSPSISTNTTYFAACVSDQFPNCKSTGDDFLLKINPNPVAPSIANGTRCGNGTVNVAVTSACANGTSLKIFSNAALTSDVTSQFTINGGTITSPSISNTTTYYAACFSTQFPECGSTGDVFVLTITPAPESDTPTTKVGTCSAGNLNDDASISINNIVGDKAAISTANATIFDGSIYADALNLNTSSVTFENLEHGSSYIIRIYNTAGCFKDVSYSTETRTCCPYPNCYGVTVIKNN